MKRGPTGIGKNEDTLAFRQFAISSGEYVSVWRCKGEAGKIVHHLTAVAGDKGCAIFVSLRAQQACLAERNDLLLVQIVHPSAIAPGHFDERSFRVSGELEHGVRHLDSYIRSGTQIWSRLQNQMRVRTAQSEGTDARQPCL